MKPVLDKIAHIEGLMRRETTVLMGKDMVPAASVQGGLSHIWNLFTGLGEDHVADQQPGKPPYAKQDKVDVQID